MILFPRVLPTTPRWHLAVWPVDDAAPQLTWQVPSTQALVHGPVCRFPTWRLPSCDVRPVADRTWGPWRIVLQLHVRKFFCANGRCPRHMLTERLSSLAAPWARRTQRLAHWLRHIAVALSGMAGARLRSALGPAVSRHTLLRLRRRLPIPRVAIPQVLGIDAWAFRNGQTSGSVLIDLERHQALARLPDREAKTVPL